ncbi:protein dopey-1-like [Ailuropoda melanoleuca]|uniref:protein dopey-1-like n=1 Tax=Ailuropoda melanoleuca TaxID=9646 RepID=UPI0014941DD4|nr:protein dopey-1-like [Ailuropoda melanoleuca]
MWDYVARWFEECCRRTLHARLQMGPGDSSESSELQLTNFCLLVDFLLDIVSLETYIEIQTEHLPQLLLRMISALTSHLQTLHLSELTDSLRLCSKILSKVQPPLLSASTGGVLQFPSGQSSSVKEWEDKKVRFAIIFGIRPIIFLQSRILYSHLDISEFFSRLECCGSSPSCRLLAV